MPRIRVALSQCNLVVGDLAGNAERIVEQYAQAVAAQCDVVAFPELAVTSYPPEDLLLKPAFVQAAQEVVTKVAAQTGSTAAVIGYPAPGLRNAVALCAYGQVLGVYAKHLLPNYAVFDEQRYFEAGDDLGPLFEINGVSVALSICEDAWSARGPIPQQAQRGADVIVSVNASPYFAGRVRDREVMLAGRASESHIPIAYGNLVGGQDELVFDGASMIVDAAGAVVARASQFVEQLLIADIEVTAADRAVRRHDRSGPELARVLVTPEQPARLPVDAAVAPMLDATAEIDAALVMGTRDYVRKNGFSDVVIGLSGGIDSSLVAAIAVDAVGADHVVGVLMPSRFSSEHSVADAEALAANLGIRTYTLPIETAHAAFESTLASAWSDADHALAGENLQARIRGTLLMTLSNTYNWLVLTTGNKSEYATGYTTLYGDMAGGFAVLKDVTKTQVYALARARNARAGTDVIPESVITKPPSAELRPDQRDEDSLMPYAQLDPILEGYVEGDRSVRELIEAGFPEAAVRRVATLVDRNEYKRRQAPPGVRVSRKAFGKDRRLPITNRWPG
ncbi:MAG: NAD+ synthase [Acidimicrobiia bacterium]